MAGWDPVQDPMGQPVSSSSVDSNTQEEDSVKIGSNSDNNGFDGYLTTNNTSNTGTQVYVPVINPYDARYPRISISTVRKFSTNNMNDSGNGKPVVMVTRWKYNFLRGNFLMSFH